VYFYIICRFNAGDTPKCAPGLLWEGGDMNGAGTAFERHVLLAVDTVGYGTGSDRAHVAVQAGLTAVLTEAAARTGLNRSAWQVQPQGDGELAILPHDESEPTVVDDYVRHLVQALTAHNAKAAPVRIRLRMAIHYGTAIRADNGYAGQGVVAVSRLVDSAPVREALGAMDADLAVILSRQVFEDVVRQGHVSFEEGDFTPVRVRVKEYTDEAWVIVLGERAHRPAPSAPGAERTAAPPAREQLPQQVNNIFNKDVHAEGAVFGFAYGSRDER
jgi:hypothetical protein